ncbi:conserved Plasmodium protein, unknown function [Plasmodium vinckei brucechwatti]|uniref:Uncharacterized protein n=1 Tax=Plasmodium vinckei brucechwatti TaxID=119398 RepID=A0A6V7S9C2_PLAVN|nr:conserved Plasmodium protein, unknown function [Plasmodium vinckei brucechwatti]
MENLNYSHNVSIDLLEPIITISVVFICLYMIISTGNPIYYYIKTFLQRTKIFLYEIKDIFTHINYYPLIVSSFFIVTYYVLHILNYNNIKYLFSVNYRYYENLLNYSINDIDFMYIFKNGISDHFLVNFLYVCKFFFHIFFINDPHISKTLFTFLFIYIILCLYARRVSSTTFIISVLLKGILSGFVLVYFFKKVLKVEYNHSGDGLFSLLFLPFFYITNPYLSAYQYNDISLHPYHGTELKFYIHVLYFLKYIIYNENYYEIKALITIIIYLIIYAKQIIDNFKPKIFMKAIWLIAYYFTTNYAPFSFSHNFKITQIFNENIIDLLRYEFKRNPSLHEFNTLSGIPFNYLISKISFFWIPYMLLNRNIGGLKYIIMLLIAINFISACTYMSTNFLPGFPLNMLLLYFLNKL